MFDRDKTNFIFTKIKILDKEHAIKYNSECIYLVVDNNKLIRKNINIEDLHFVDPDSVMLPPGGFL